ncbi:hypothetical protein CK203_099375 [Vitis vinifera]|uniref:Integrase catalytic domain-containing protein n=1 Tax=Vitis vinifera TaxID=29760 RepID=A0A438CHP3_VITVI|nr:hypothetical protein CK203_099375 [Vitis vinifera]
MDGMQNDLSQKIDNLQYSISRLTYLNTMQEKGKFHSQPHQNPKDIHEVEAQEEESSQVREVKEVITLRSGKEVDLPTSKPEHEPVNEAEKEKREGIKERENGTVERMRTLNLLDDWRDVCGESFVRLGASVNSLPYSVYKQLGLRELKPTSITLSLLDRSVKIPRGMIEDVLVQVDKFYYPVDFVVLDTDPVAKGTNCVPIILGRQLLATPNAIINCRNGVIQLTFGNMTLELNIFYLCKKQFHPEEEEGPEEEEEILPLFNGEETQEAVEEPPKLILKPLPTELKYAYLEKTSKALLLFNLLPLLRRIVYLKSSGDDHFPLPFIDQVLERVSGHPFYCFLDGYSGYFQIEIDVEDQEKTTFTCLFRTYAYKRMSLGLCNAPYTKGLYLGILSQSKALKWTKQRLNLFQVAIATTVKGVRQFLGHVGSIGGLSKISLNLQDLFVNYCESSQWQLPFEVMCDANDFAIGVVLGQREDGKPYDAKVRLIRWILLLQEFNLHIKDKKGIENVVADHLSRLAITHNSHSLPINDDFLEESLMLMKSLLVIPCKRNDHRVVLKFLKENVFSRFGVPKAIISDGGTHFCNNPFETLLAKLMKVVNTSRRDWSVKLHDSQWASRTAYKTILAMSPYRLVYDKACHLLVEVEYKAWWAIKKLNMDLS